MLERVFGCFLSAGLKQNETDKKKKNMYNYKNIFSEFYIYL